MKVDQRDARIKSAVSATALALGILAAGCAATPSGEPAPALSPQIEAARTPADHEALAQEYERRAAQARAEAEQHRALLAAYKRGTQYRWIDRVGPAGSVSTGMPAMPRHCEQLVRNDEDSARIYSEMAHQHREWARQAPSGEPE